jgi:hypothetical protein
MNSLGRIKSMRTSIYLTASFALVAGPVVGQTTPSSTSTTHKDTLVGTVTHQKTVNPIGNGTHTTNIVSPGDGSKPSVYVGTTTSDPTPNKSLSTTVPQAGIVIPFGKD